MILFELFIGFLKVGCFAFGGAYGAIPLIRDVVLSYGWLDEEMLTYMIAVSESTPGPIMVNLATYVGNSQAGLAGSILATVAVVLPSFLIVLMVTVLLKTLLKSPYVQAVLRGIKPCMIGIILATGVYMIWKNGVVLQENSL
ncbi:MAG: chromate transporter, partial [Clostridia bacterium]|nr:chromate transporter [Clostridia bacterium]